MRSPAARLAAAAAAVHARAANGHWLPTGLFFTDPDRIADPAAVIARLPRGFGVVIRHFGRPAAVAAIAALVQLARRRGVKVLIGADIGLARRLRADGVHLPERLAHLARHLPPRWTVTVAWHPRARRRPPRQVDALVISPLFASASASAGRPLGHRDADKAAQRAGLPCYGLGGMTPRTARALRSRTWIGIAAVEGFRT
jgi:thiamine-phosphate pyrophosphorylase